MEVPDFGRLGPAGRSTDAETVAPLTSAEIVRLLRPAEEKIAWQLYERSARPNEAAWEELGAVTPSSYVEPPVPGYDAQGYDHS